MSTNHRINKFILADTGFWFGLCDPGDNCHQRSIFIAEALSRFNFVLPWPILYEVLHTQFVKHAPKIQAFDRALDQFGVERINDQRYREAALEAVRGSAKINVPNRRNISLVDMVLRLMIENEGLRIDALITYNAQDFVDSCRKRQIPLIQDYGDLTALPR